MSDENSDPRGEAKPGRGSDGRFLPGSPHNPGGLGGRPKGSSMMREIERQLALEQPDGRTNQELIVDKLIARAKKGDMRAAELLLKRVAPERLAIESDGLPLVLLRNFAGVEPEPPRLPEGGETPAPVLDVGVVEEELPEGAEKLPDGTVRWRLSS